MARDDLISGLDPSSDSPPDPADDPRAFLRAAVRDVLEANPDGSIDELNAALERHARIYNRRPQRELLGLSPDQAGMLLYGPWDGTGVLRLRSDLPLAALEGSRLLHNARVILNYLIDKGGVKATASTGSLSRAAVADLLPRMRWARGAPDLPPDVRVNEGDLIPVHLPRLLLELSRLIKRRKGVFSTTAAGRRIAAEDRAGDLFALLFHTLFQELNLAYLFRWGPEAPELQSTVGFTLFRLARVAKEWTTPERLARDTLLPKLRAELETETGLFRPDALLESRILWPLEELGLLRMREKPVRKLGEARREYRKAPLFDRFLSFSFAR